MTTARTRLLAGAAVLAAAIPLLGAAPASAKSCTPGAYPGQGYFTSLKVSRISCNRGRRVMRAHYTCRTKHGIKGKCRRAAGFRCSEKRYSIATEYNSRVTCKKGRRRVVYTYQQNT